MTTGQIIRLVFQALVFAAWTFMMFRMLFILQSRDAKQGGGPFPSTGGFITQLKYWLSSEEDRTDRRTLFFLTFVMLAMIATDVLAASLRAP